MKRLFPLLVCLSVILGSLTAYAAIPEKNDKDISLPYSVQWNKIVYGYAGNNGSASTITDGDMGTVYRWTSVAGGSNYARFMWDVSFGNDKNFSTGVKANDKFYVSFYYRINNAQSDSAVTAANPGLQVSNALYDDKNFVTMDGVTTGQWQYYESINSILVDRDWYQNSLYFNLTGLGSSEIASIDFAGIRLLYLGAATEEEGKTILQQVQEMQSNDSSIQSIRIGSTEIDLEQNPSVYSVVGTPEGVAKSVVVTPNNASAIVKTRVEDTLCIITVYSERANLISPVAGTYTEYYIECETPQVTISENEGKGTRAAYDGLYVVEGANVERVPYTDEAFGTVYRYGMEYNSGFRWPKFDLAFRMEEPRNASANDYVYFSYYWRNNTAAEDTKVTAAPNYLTRSSQVQNLTGTVNVGHSGDGTMKPGEWHREEYIIPMGAAKENFDSLAAKFQFGIPEEAGKYVSFDFANPECYYLGEVSYYDGAPAEEFNNAVIAKIKSCFSDSAEVSAMTIGGRAVDLTANPTSIRMSGSPALLANSLFLEKVEGAYTAVTYPTASTMKIKVFPHLSDMRTVEASKCWTYEVTMPITVDGWELQYNGQPMVADDGFQTGVYTLTARLTNNSGNATTGSFLLAAYDSENHIIAIGGAESGESIADGTGGTVSGSITLESVPQIIRLFTWDDARTMRPLMGTLGINHRGNIAY